MVTPDRVSMAASEAANSNGNGDLLNNQKFMGNFMGLVQNEFLTRSEFIRKWMDARRDYNKECGYPETNTVRSDNFQEYYDRHPIASRVVELFPTECWQITPDVFETEDASETTPFEQSFQDLALALRGEDSYYKPEEEVVHPLWEYCRRIDILSGIGQYGVMLLGVDDGLSLNQPVEGWTEDEVQDVTWNQAAVPFLQEEIGKHVTVNERGELVWNAPEDEEEEEDNAFAKEEHGDVPEQEDEQVQELTEEDPVEKKKRLQATEGAKSTPLDTEQVNKSGYSEQAFGNKANPQQQDYHDPMKNHERDDPQPIDDQQPEYGDLETTGDNVLKPEGESQQEEPQQAGRKLLYIRVFPQSLVSIIQYEQNMQSPRFGQPTMYRITLNDPLQLQEGVGLPLSTVEVHYSRLIHVADVGANAVSSEIFATPRMRPVLNNLIDLQKIYGAVGEGYWKNAFATLAAETHPQLGGDVTIDSADLRAQMKKWRDSLDRVLAATGVTWKTIAPQLVDPNSYVQNEINAICIKMGCPVRVFMGSEQGQLASTQDTFSWGFRVKERRKNYLTTRLIVPLINRLIRIGILQSPTQGFNVSWEEDQKLTPAEQAQVGSAVTQALATYISGQVDQLIEPVTWLVDVMGWDRDKAKGAVQATVEHIQKQQELEANAPTEMIDPTTGQPLQQDPETGQPIGPDGQPLQQDEMGKPVMMGPDGMPMPVQSQKVGAEGPLAPEAAEAQMGMDGPMDEQVPPDQAISSEEPQAEGQEEVDPEYGLPIDPQTGMLLHPQSGVLIDKNNGNIYSPQGELLGNLENMEDDEDEQEFEEGEPGAEGFQEEGFQDQDQEEALRGGMAEGDAEEVDADRNPQELDQGFVDQGQVEEEPDEDLEEDEDPDEDPNEADEIEQEAHESRLDEEIRKKVRKNGR